MPKTMGSSVLEQGVILLYTGGLFHLRFTVQGHRPFVIQVIVWVRSLDVFTSQWARHKVPKVLVNTQEAVAPSQND